MTATAPDRTRLEAHHRRVLRNLVDAHARRADEPLLLAVRFGLDDPEDLHLLEVLDGFPGGDDDPLFTTEFPPSAELVIFGRLHLTLATPAQLRAALRRGDDIIRAVRSDGEVLYPDAQHRRAHPVAEELLNELHL